MLNSGNRSHWTAALEPSKFSRGLLWRNSCQNELNHFECRQSVHSDWHEYFASLSVSQLKEEGYHLECHRRCIEGICLLKPSRTAWFATSQAGTRSSVSRSVWRGIKSTDAATTKFFLYIPLCPQLIRGGSSSDRQRAFARSASFPNSAVSFYEPYVHTAHIHAYPLHTAWII